MKRIFAIYEHSLIGFPGVVLKWAEENGRMEPNARIVINGVIESHPWVFSQENTALELRIDRELAKFNQWVCDKFGDRADVQG